MQERVTDTDLQRKYLGLCRMLRRLLKKWSEESHNLIRNEIELCS
jgi:hypothetical protein